MRKTLLVTFFAAAAAFGQSPVIADAKSYWTMVKGNLVKSAEKMPEENYSFKPTPEVRSFGELVGHVANASYFFCSRVNSEKPPQVNIEKTVTDKAGLVKALSESAAYCDAAFAALNDTNMVETTKMMGRDMTKLGLLNFQNAHSMEHYGNMVTYLRMKGLVPPSSEK